MGFLLGAFGKLAAGRRVRDLQARMMRVQTKARRVTRQIEQMSKMLETQKKMELNALSAQEYQMTAQLGSYSGAGDANSAEYAQWNTQQANDKAQMQYQMSMAKQAIEEKYEQMNDFMLEPLKQEEDSLQTEKDSLESQIQIAQADYEACKKMESADAKNLAPNYTGQG